MDATNPKLTCRDRTPVAESSHLFHLPVRPSGHIPMRIGAGHSKNGAALTSLMNELHVGSEFFLNRSETKDSVEKHFRLMHDNGFTLVRIFVIWDDIERTPGNWNFEGYDWINDAAAKNGIKIAETLCAEDPPGWMNRTTFYHQRANLDDPEVRSHAEIYPESRKSL